MKNLICQTLGVTEIAGHTNYLGKSSVIGRGKNVFHYVVEKFTKRIQGWKAKVLSKVGKDILLRTVAQAMPNYLMSLFLLPLDTCKDLENLMNGFFWHNGGRENNGIRWLQWKRLAIPKIYGGLGYRDLRQFNLALSAKQGWRLLKYPNFIAIDFFSAELGNNLNQIWRNPWLMDDGDPYIQTGYKEHFKYVAELIMDHRWNEEMIRRFFDQQDVELILQILLGFSRRKDDWMWTLNNQGEYRVK
ncbi:hypothetical protein K2173_018507 [Erythroxylum novogranatense]|uniref:Uncharacterized protein n=1 Tax=Erythroxylum novogranatense TaxID=1862640 RepID=A0AAV8UDB1_9ROSI|nr:hypothetical protein K2173_018507 [Erythroxylum novogranatense]